MKKSLTAIAALAMMAASCSSSDDPKVQPEPEKKPDVWYLSEMIETDDAAPLDSYYTRIRYNADTTVSMLDNCWLEEGDTVRAPQWFTYDAGRISKLEDQEPGHQRGTDKTFEYSGNRVTTVKEWGLNQQNVSAVIHTRQLTYNTAGKLEKIASTDVSGTYKTTYVLSWTGGDITEMKYYVWIEGKDSLINIMKYTYHEKPNLMRSLLRQNAIWATQPLDQITQLSEHFLYTKKVYEKAESLQNLRQSISNTYEYN